MTDDARTGGKRYHFDRHTPDYRSQFDEIRREMQASCPIAWSDTHGGHWVAAGAKEVFELARSADILSSDHDIDNERGGPRYQGITLPAITIFRSVSGDGPTGTTRVPAGTERLSVARCGRPVGAVRCRADSRGAR